MANRADRFYFENFVEAADYACKAAEYLEQCLTVYDPEKMSQMLEEMHTIEHTGDQKKHEMSAALAKAFVTPIDREDLAVVSQKIDEVTDGIEEVLQRFYVNQVQSVRSDAITFAKMISECCQLMKKMLVELENFKKPDRLRASIIEVNRMEERCDHYYLEAIMQMRKQSTDILDFISWREIYDYMEECADACEHVADSVGTVVMKNT